MHELPWMRTGPQWRGSRVCSLAAVVTITVAASLLASCAQVRDDAGPDPSTGGSVDPPVSAGGDPGAFLLLDTATVPDSALVNSDIDGIVAEVNWRDSLGDHRLVLRKEVDYVSADPADGVARVLLAARHYTAGAAGSEVSLAAELASESSPCPDGDIVDDLWPETLSASDADGNGIGEASFLFTTGCVTGAVADVIAHAMTAGEVYVASGPRPVPGDAGGVLPAQVDPATPGIIRERLIALWSSPLERVATAVDWREGSPGIQAAASRVLDEYGELGPQTAVPPNAGTPGTAGSGCVVEPGNTLPDGVWAGYLNAADGTEAAFDVVCFLTVPAAREAGVDSSFAGFRFDDDSEGQRPVPWREGATVHVQTNPPVRPLSEATETVSFDAGDVERVQAYLREFPRPFGWLLVEDGRAVEFWSPPLAGG